MTPAVMTMFLPTEMLLPKAMFYLQSVFLSDVPIHDDISSNTDNISSNTDNVSNQSLWATVFHQQYFLQCESILGVRGQCVCMYANKCVCWDEEAISSPAINSCKWLALFGLI